MPMLDTANPVHTELITSTLSWWEEAGVSHLVDEVPTPWLGRVKAAAAPSTAAPSNKRAAAPPPPAAAKLPETLPDLTHWLQSSPDVPDAGPPMGRIAAAGDPASPLMIMIDMPEMGDPETGLLLSGAPGELFDKMLAAIGRDRSSVYLTTFAPGRPPGGRLSESAIALLEPIARHHIGLAAPKRLWLMGQTVSRAIIGADAAPGHGRLREINHQGGIVVSVASFAPRFLLQHPKQKAAAWADMQALIEGI
jgi:uracil-DNA glycosylase